MTEDGARGEGSPFFRWPGSGMGRLAAVVGLATTATWLVIIVLGLAGLASPGGAAAKVAGIGLLGATAAGVAALQAIIRDRERCLWVYLSLLPAAVALFFFVADLVVGK